MGWLDQVSEEERLYWMTLPYYDPCGCGHCHDQFSPGPCPSLGEMEANRRAYEERRLEMEARS